MTALLTRLDRQLDPAGRPSSGLSTYRRPATRASTHAGTLDTDPGSIESGEQPAVIGWPDEGDGLSGHVGGQVVS
jgi:hypothetical protein